MCVARLADPKGITVSGCPFNTWRNSYDEAYTLFDTALFLLNMNARNTATISRPGCWAMAGMLMLGVGALPHDRTLSQLSHSLDDSMNQ